MSATTEAGPYLSNNATKPMDKLASALSSLDQWIPLPLLYRHHQPTWALQLLRQEGRADALMAPDSSHLSSQRPISRVPRARSIRSKSLSRPPPLLCQTAHPTFQRGRRGGRLIAVVIGNRGSTVSTQRSLPEASHGHTGSFHFSPGGGEEKNYTSVPVSAPSVHYRVSSEGRGNVSCKAHTQNYTFH